MVDVRKEGFTKSTWVIHFEMSMGPLGRYTLLYLAKVTFLCLAKVSWKSFIWPRPVNIPIPKKRAKMGGEFTYQPKWYPQPIG